MKFTKKDILTDIMQSESPNMEAAGNISYALTALSKMIFNQMYGESCCKDEENDDGGEING